MVLGGVTIPADVHLRGHSDADAIAHAVTDAILGAAGEGDIGLLFPDTDAANAGRNSVEMLTAAVGRINAAGWRVNQVDITVVTERPHIQAHRLAIAQRLAGALGILPSDVNVKGKTNEGLGWVGRGEGLAVFAVATIAADGVG